MLSAPLSLRKPIFDRRYSYWYFQEYRTEVKQVLPAWTQNCDPKYSIYPFCEGESGLWLDGLTIGSGESKRTRPSGNECLYELAHIVTHHVDISAGRPVGLR